MFDNDPLNLAAIKALPPVPTLTESPDCVGHTKPLRETVEQMLARARNAALDAGCAVIQEYLGVTSGDFAGMFFSDEDDEVRAALHRYFVAQRDEPAMDRRFTVDGRLVAYTNLVIDNLDDEALQEWARSCAVGDVFPALAVECKRVA